LQNKTKPSKTELLPKLIQLLINRQGSFTQLEIEAMKRQATPPE
jgi:hypothetical protein